MTTAASIIKTAQRLLVDTEGARWPATVLVGYLNDGQRDIATLRPDQFTVSAPYLLAAGARQAVPAACSKLVDIPRNTSGAGIRQVARDLLDAIDPDWYGKSGTTAIKHFTHDPREPGTFYVWPPAAIGASVDVVYAALPVEVPAATGPTFAGVSGAIGVPDVFANALTHFIAFRALSEDSESGNVALATGHYQLYKTALSEDLVTRQAVKPTTEAPA